MTVRPHTKGQKMNRKDHQHQQQLQAGRCLGLGPQPGLCVSLARATPAMQGSKGDMLCSSSGTSPGTHKLPQGLPTVQRERALPPPVCRLAKISEGLLEGPATPHPPGRNSEQTLDKEPWEVSPGLCPQPGTSKGATSQTQVPPAPEARPLVSSQACA